MLLLTIDKHIPPNTCDSIERCLGEDGAMMGVDDVVVHRKRNVVVLGLIEWE